MGYKQKVDGFFIIIRNNLQTFMTWLRSFGMLEYILTGIFILFYSIYIIRILLIGRKMKSEMRSVFYKFILRSFYFFLLMIALLGPSFGNVKKEIKSISKEIYLVTDLSLSMRSTDIQPSRIEKAIHEIKKITSSLSSDRIGIIGFSSTATILCPLTFDQSAINTYTDALSANITGSEGSDLSVGLELAKQELTRSSNAGFNKAIILITDGEDFGKNAMKTANELQANKIQLMILAVGTEKGSKIPFNGAFKKDNDGNEVISRVDKEYLNELADAAEGVYFEVNDRVNETESVINRVNAIEGTVSDVREVDASANKYLYFLTAAFFFILIDVLITVRTVKI